MKITFEFETKYGVYRDALYLPDDHTYTNEQIAEMQSERLNKWLFSIENPVNQDETVVIDGVTYTKTDIDGQLVLKPVEI